MGQFLDFEGTKILANKIKEADNKIETLKTSQTLEYTGENIICENTLTSRTSDVVVKGQTYQNLIDYNDATMKGSSTATVEKSQNSIKATVTKNGSSIVYFPCKMLKDNTVYTLLFNLITNYNSSTLTASFKQEGGSFAEGSINIKSGYCKIKITTTTANEGICIGNLGTEVIGNNIEIQNLIVLEGDWTDKEVPASITGIESAGEKENKISILSHNKNLFNINNEKISYGDMKTTITGNTLKIEPITNRAWSSVNIKVDGLKNGVSYEINCQKEQYHLEDDKIAIFQDKGNIFVGSLRDKSFTVQKNIDTDNLYLRIHCSDERENRETVILKDIMIREASTTEKFVTQKIDKKEILLPFEGGLKSLPNGVCDTIEQRNDGVYLVQRVGKVILANLNYSVILNSDIGLIARALLSDIASLTDINYLSNLNIGNSSAWKFDEWFGKFPIAINTGNIQDGNQKGIEILVQKRNIPSITDLASFKKYLQDNSAVLYYELNTPVGTKLDINNLDLEVYKDITYVTTDNAIQPTLSFKVPSNLAGIVEDNTNNININSDSIEQINLTLQNFTPVKLADGAYIGGNTINLNDSLNNYKRFMIVVGDGNGNPNIWKTYNFTNYSYPGNFITASDMIMGAENLVLTVKSGGNAIEVTTMTSSYIRKVFGLKY